MLGAELPGDWLAPELLLGQFALPGVQSLDEPLEEMPEPDAEPVAEPEAEPLVEPDEPVLEDDEPGEPGLALVPDDASVVLLPELLQAEIPATIAAAIAALITLSIMFTLLFTVERRTTEEREAMLVPGAIPMPNRRRRDSSLRYISRPFGGDKH